MEHPLSAESLRLIQYLSFKADCAREQEESKWKIDVNLCEKTLEFLYKEKEKKVEALKEVMPDRGKYVTKEYPAKPFKKDGTLSVTGAKWKYLLKQKGLPPDHKDPIRVLHSTEPPNPGSTVQVKDWLFSLGWKPITFKFEKENDGGVRQIPQVRREDEDRNKVLCPSVLRLAEKEPAIYQLEGLTVINHRISILEGFLENRDENDCIVAAIQGLTNTLRFKHKIAVNLPGVDKPYGKEIRGCLIAREGNELCGSDISSLEDNTKRHYIYPYDPEYVKEMNKPGFDPHMKLLVIAGKITEEDYEFYINYKEANK